MSRRLNPGWGFVAFAVLTMGCGDREPAPPPIAVEHVAPASAKGSLAELRAELRLRCQTAYGEKWNPDDDGEECLSLIRAPMPPAPPTETAETGTGTATSCGTIDLESGEITLHDCGDWM